MAKFQNNEIPESSRILADAVAHTVGTIKQNQNAKAAVGNVVGLEGYTDGNASQTRTQVAADATSALTTMISRLCNEQNASKKVKAALENLTDAQREAAAITLMAAADPTAYAAKAMSEHYPALEEHCVDAPVVTFGNAGGMDTAPSIGLEYFTDQKLDTYMAASVRFNVAAARQDHFSETIMPTIVADPTEAGLLVQIKKTVVHRAVKHAIRDKDSKPYNRRNILDGITDPSVLEDESIRFVPYRLEDGDNKELFIDEALYAPRAYPVGDYEVMSAPLKFGGKKNLLRLSAHPGLVSSGVLDESDELNGRVDLAAVYVTVAKKGAAPEDVALVRLKTENTARATFNAAQEGDSQEMLLNYTGATFVLSGDSVDVDGNPIPAVDELNSNGWQMNYTFDVNNRLNLTTGAESSMVGAVDVLSLMDENGVKTSHTQGSGKIIVDDLVITPVSYDYKASRSNANRRTKGLLVDSIAEKERYKIQLGSPITSRKPIGRLDNSQALEDIITAARIRTSNQAVTKILNVTDVLREVVKSYGEANQYDIPSIEGVGRHYVRPWFDEDEIVISDIVSNRENSTADKNLSASIMGVIREQVCRAIQESRYQPALEMISGYTLTQPTVIIGTDIYVASWLERWAENRSLGDQFEYEIVTTNDKRWHGRIQWFLKASAGENGLNVLNWGNHLWVPELITDTNLTRNDGTSNEVTVQPRNTHIVNCPITGVVVVKGIREFVRNKPTIGIDVKSGLSGDANIGDLIPDTGV